MNLACLIAILSAPHLAEAQPLSERFVSTGTFAEQARWDRLPGGIRVLTNAPQELTARPRTLVIYATPNGNSIEQTFGSAPVPGQDFRFDIQHIAAQVRCWRATVTDANILVSIVQAPRLSWPAFRAEHPDANRVIPQLVSSLATEFKADRIVLSGHSGGGSFLLGYVAGVDSVPASIERMILLDANYSYSDDQHGDKLVSWLRGNPNRRLIVLAYDDREIELNGKKVVGPDGGTFRATGRMKARFAKEFLLTESLEGPFHRTIGMEGQLQFFVHPNPDNKILHTALVGDMNGLLHGLALGTADEKRWGALGGPRAYQQWVSPQPIVEHVSPRAKIVETPGDAVLSIPTRPETSPTGRQFRDQIASLGRKEREAAIVAELAHGNLPQFLRRLVTIRVEWTAPDGDKHQADYRVLPDYLAVGSDDDFFRVPMTPQSALAIAEKFGASLITTRISDDLYSAAVNKLTPKPLTKDRDSVATFYQHHEIIQAQLGGKPRALVAGLKKDVVLSNRLKEKPQKVAIYGWHQAEGTPIQPLYVGHVDWYVDYSHGVRLMSNQMIVDGQVMSVDQVLQHPVLHRLLSSEGPINTAEIRQAAEW